MISISRAGDFIRIFPKRKHHSRFLPLFPSDRHLNHVMDRFVSLSDNEQQRILYVPLHYILRVTRAIVLIKNELSIYTSHIFRSLTLPFSLSLYIYVDWVRLALAHQTTLQAPLATPKDQSPPVAMVTVAMALQNPPHIPPLMAGIHVFQDQIPRKVPTLLVG